MKNPIANQIALAFAKGESVSVCTEDGVIRQVVRVQPAQSWEVVTEDGHTIPADKIVSVQINGRPA